MHTASHAARHQGFTLIELMITIVIVGIITAVALPSYSSYVAKGRRADARNQLLVASQYMQRFQSANDRYDTARDGTAVLTAMPTAVKQSPQEGTALYTLSVSASATDYTLTMAPVSGQSMASDTCGSYLLRANGQRSNVVGSTTLTTAQANERRCWN